MKIWINILAVFVFATSLIAGKMYWNNEVSEQSASRPTKVGDSSKMGDGEGTWKQYAQNLPKAVTEKIQKAEDTHEPMKLVIVGTAPKEAVQATWAALLKEKMEEVYDPSLIDIEVHEYKDMTTLRFIKNDTYKEISNAKPDVLLFEPFLLNDNGVVGINNTLENIKVIMRHIEQQNGDLVTILLPSAPVYKANNYPNDAKALEEFAKENGYEYINHWTAWPDYRSEDILNYLTKTPGQPNDGGEKLWAQYLENYFTNSESNL
ncbi:SGNH/GDSL hydrolase family protein [Priestia megaterium]|uniref:SGNH/GDSL hydrolase family protein n=1 Tax=Priestia megaterium TaxID=1404 RepID=UPI00227DE92B|nr:SGNH/GDSL hydrolase family protein [Priestia megaterium]MCY9023240.1 SGNH/GDSL hydrolase family protein [Priestia megaterium]